jgi:hypothetical protein
MAGRSTRAALAALVGKELRQMLPVAIGLFALFLLHAVQVLLLRAPDEAEWVTSTVLNEQSAGSTSAWGLLAVGLMTAYALTGEHEQRTIEFLYTLPVRRSVVFLTKFAVGSGVLVAFNLAAAGMNVLLMFLNPDSFARRQQRLDLVALELGLLTGLGFIVVAYGLLLAFFRRLGWILLALIAMALQLAERLHPPLRLLNVSALLTFEHHGTEPLVPWPAWQVHGALSALALALAARLWLADPDRTAAFFERWRARSSLRRVLIGLGLIAGALLAAYLIAGRNAGEQATEPAPRERPLAVLETAHFRFSYWPEREAEARLVAREADEAYRRLRAWLPGASPESIVVDLTEVSDEHQGIAGWKTMRMDVTGDKPPELLEHVLYHETTHVLAAALAEGTSEERQAGLRFFSEGLAEYLAFELLGERPARQLGRQVAALATHRYRLRWEDLLDPVRFLARHDEYLLYPLGELWVAALVETCGQAAPARALEGFASPENNQRLAGAELWRQSLQGQGCDLAAVNARYRRQLDALEPLARRLPRAAATFLREAEDQLLFDVEVIAPEPGPWPVSLRARDDPQTPPAQVTHAHWSLTTGRHRQLAVPRPALTGRRFEFQVSAAPGPDLPAFFTRWQSSSLRGR